LNVTAAADAVVAGPAAVTAVDGSAVFQHWTPMGPILPRFVLCNFVTSQIFDLYWEHWASSSIWPHSIEPKSLVDVVVGLFYSRSWAEYLRAF
jgi:hypothetical protein